MFSRGPQVYQFFHNCHVFILFKYLPYLTLPYWSIQEKMGWHIQLKQIFQPDWSIPFKFWLNFWLLLSGTRSKNIIFGHKTVIFSQARPTSQLKTTSQKISTRPKFFLKVDNSVHWINLYPVDHAIIGFLIIICWIGNYPVDSSTQGLIFADQLFASAFDFGKYYWSVRHWQITIFCSTYSDNC